MTLWNFLGKCLTQHWGTKACWSKDFIQKCYLIQREGTASKGRKLKPDLQTSERSCKRYFLFIGREKRARRNKVWGWGGMSRWHDQTVDEERSFLGVS